MRDGDDDAEDDEETPEQDTMEIDGGGTAAKRRKKKKKAAAKLAEAAATVVEPEQESVPGIPNIVLPGDIIPLDLITSIRDLNVPEDAAPLPTPSLTASKKKKEKDDGTTTVTTDAGGLVKIGPGLMQTSDGLRACKAGQLRYTVTTTTHPTTSLPVPLHKIWIEQSQRRYVAAVGESVVGVITYRGAEQYRVDIGGAHHASLDALAFEGATKRNKPNLEVGHLVYARIFVANKDMEPEIECVNPSTGRSDGFGELKGGFMFKCSLGLSRSLLSPTNPLLAALGKLFPFETAVGMNGRIWVNAATPLEIVVLTNALKGSEGLPTERVREYVHGVRGMMEEMRET
ncbi:Exosome component 3 [Irineochytrium annulatum]|nr:Exosome component 3 [Irineochytrium annulatum]